MKITFLGTGAGIPSKQRNVSSIALQLMKNKGAIWLFDCGEATQHQILNTPIKPRKIEKIFITHLHGDHIYGLTGLISSRSFQDGRSPLTIYGPKGTEEFVQTSLKVSETNVLYPIEFIEVFDGYQINFDDYSVDVIALDHGMESYGYRVTENDQIGELQVEKLKALGIEPGPLYQKIKENEVTQLPNGHLINRNDVVGPTKKGRKIVIFGDTRNSGQFVEFLKGSDLLIHEATFSGTDQALAKQYYHSSNIEVAELAKKADVKQLILTHLSARYQNEQLNQFLCDARTIFPETILAEDFLTLKIPKVTE